MAGEWLCLTRIMQPLFYRQIRYTPQAPNAVRFPTIRPKTNFKNLHETWVIIIISTNFSVHVDVASREKVGRVGWSLNVSTSARLLLLPIYYFFNFQRFKTDSGFSFYRWRKKGSRIFSSFDWPCGCFCSLFLTNSRSIVIARWAKSVKNTRQADVSHWFIRFLALIHANVTGFIKYSSNNALAELKTNSKDRPDFWPCRRITGAIFITDNWVVVLFVLN